MPAITLVQGSTYTFGNLIFDINEPTMKTQNVSDEVANFLLDTGKFKINDNTIKEVAKPVSVVNDKTKKKYYDILFMLHHISNSEGYGSLGTELSNKYFCNVDDIRDGAFVNDSLKVKLDSASERSNIIQMCAGDLFKEYHGYNKNVGYTMFETTKLPSSPRVWVDVMNKNVDLVLVPAEEVKKVFINSGVKVPVEVVPLWVNDAYKYVDRPKREVFKFLWAGKLDGFNRKGCLDAVEAFKEEFKNEPNVRLVIKATTISLTEAKIDEILDDERISFVKGILSRREFMYLFKDADCFVFPTHGEGFGLPPLEAMATGLPTIITDWMGCSEFASNDVCYPIKVNKLEKAYFPPIYGDVGEWAAIDIKRVRKLMRHVYENREEAKQKGINAAKLVDEKYRFSNFDENVKKAIGLNTKVKDKVSIIIAVKDNVGYLKNCVDSIYKHTPEDFELIIIDNGSGIEVKNYLTDLCKEHDVKVITNKENMGYAYACDQGILVASGEYLCMLDIDTIVSPMWLKDMLDCMKKNKQCGVVVPSQSFIEDMNYVKFKRNIAFAYIEDDIAEFSKTLEKGEYEEKQIREIYGYCHLVRKEVFNNIGVYDWEWYKGAAVNETDLFWRAQLNGWKLYWAKGAYVYHYHGVVKKSLGMDDYDMVEKGNARLKEKQLHPEKYYVFNNATVEGI